MQSLFILLGAVFINKLSTRQMADSANANASNDEPTKDAIAQAPPASSSDSHIDANLDNEKHDLPSLPAKEDRARLNASVVCKYDTRLMPFVFLGLLLFWLDRTSIALARINGLEEDLHMRGAQFNMATMVFAITYLVFSVPSNLLIRRFGGGRWLPLVVCAWGMVTVGSAFVTSFGTLCLTRVLLGIAEAGFMGSVLLYLGFFYTSDELTARIGIFFASTPLSGSVGGLLAAALTRIRHPRLDRWPWIFLVEGILTFLLGLMAFFVLPNSPDKASFLTPEEKSLAQMRTQAQERWHFMQHTAPEGLRESRRRRPVSALDVLVEYQPATIAPAPNDTLRCETFRHAILHSITLLMTLGAFFTICALYSYSLFLPTIIATMGFGGSINDNLKATLLTVPPNVVGAVFCIVATQWSQRTGTFSIPLVTSSALASIGYILLLVGSFVAGSTPGVFDATGGDGNQTPSPPRVLPALQYVGTFFVAMGVNALSPLAMTWVSLNASPHYVRAIALGFIIMVGSFGGVVASFTYIKTAEPRYAAPYSLCKACSSALLGLATDTCRQIHCRPCSQPRVLPGDHARWRGHGDLDARREQEKRSGLAR